MLRIRDRLPAVLMGALLVSAFALTGCGRAAFEQASLSGSCADALAARAEAMGEVEISTQQAVTRNGARAAQLQAIANEAAKELAAAVDLAPCDDESATTGTVVDVADLRARYSVILERTQATLDATASQPAQDTKGKKGQGTKDD